MCASRSTGATVSSRRGRTRQTAAAHFERKTFHNCDVHLDAGRFVDCAFVQATLIYSGGKPPNIVDCSFKDVRFRFDGPAGATVAFLVAMARPDSGLQQIVRNTFASFSLN